MRIAVTRLEGKEGTDGERCRKFGHTCYRVSPLRASVHRGRVESFAGDVNEGAFDALFFTSALPARLIAPLLTRWPRVIAIGPQTAGALAEYGIAAETLPSHYSRAFVPYLGGWIRGQRIGIPRAGTPNTALIQEVTRAGGVVTEVACYDLIATGERLDLSGAGGILFTSAMSFSTAVWTPEPAVLVMAIGDVTASTMSGAGVPAAVIGDGTLEGTLDQLNKYLAQR